MRCARSDGVPACRPVCSHACSRFAARPRGTRAPVGDRCCPVARARRPLEIGRYEVDGSFVSGHMNLPSSLHGDAGIDLGHSVLTGHAASRDLVGPWRGIRSRPIPRTGTNEGYARPPTSTLGRGSSKDSESSAAVWRADSAYLPVVRANLPSGEEHRRRTGHLVGGCPSQRPDCAPGDGVGFHRGQLASQRAGGRLARFPDARFVAGRHHPGVGRHTSTLHTGAGAVLVRALGRIWVYRRAVE